MDRSDNTLAANDSDAVAQNRLGARPVYVLIILTTVYVFSFMDRQILSILQDDIKAEFGLQDYQLGLLTGFSFALFYTTLGVPIARLADRFNRVRIISIALAFWSIMTAICGMAGSYLALFFARMGVGVGEAGGGAPTYSIFADYFKPQDLPKAVGFYGAGATFGAVLGLVMGGFVAEAVGWRTAFIVAGLPGVLLALVVWFTVVEPERGRMSPEKEMQSAQLPFWQTAKELFKFPIYVPALLAHAFGTTISYAVGTWLPPYFGRFFDLGRGDIILYTSIVFIVGGMFGVLAGGAIASRLSVRGKHWQGYVPMIGGLLAAPLLVAGFSGITGLIGSCALITLGTFFVQWAFAPSTALIQSSISSDRRALAASIVMLISNIIGLGLAPVIIGLLSDYFVSTQGDASLSTALMIFSNNALLAAIFGWIAAQKAKQDQTP